MEQKEVIRTIYINKVPQRANQKNLSFTLQRNATTGDFIIEYTQAIVDWNDGAAVKEHRILLIQPNGDCYNGENYFKTPEEAKVYFENVVDVDIKEYLDIE